LRRLGYASLRVPVEKRCARKKCWSIRESNNWYKTCLSNNWM
jgi:hypothetical protein